MIALGSAVPIAEKTAVEPAKETVGIEKSAAPIVPIGETGVDDQETAGSFIWPSLLGYGYGYGRGLYGGLYGGYYSPYYNPYALGGYGRYLW